MDLQHCNVVRQKNQTNHLSHSSSIIYQQGNRHERYLHEKPYNFPIEHFMPVVANDILEYCHRESRFESLSHGVVYPPWDDYPHC